MTSSEISLAGFLWHGPVGWVRSGCTIVRITCLLIWKCLHFSPDSACGRARGVHFSSGSIHVAFYAALCPTLRQCCVLIQIRLTKVIWILTGFLWALVHISPPRPGLFLSALPEFLEKDKFFQVFPGVGIVSAFFSPDYCTAPDSPASNLILVHKKIQINWMQNDFIYLYLLISKIHLWDLLTCKWIYTFDWVG